MIKVLFILAILLTGGSYYSSNNKQDQIEQTNDHRYKHCYQGYPDSWEWGQCFCFRNEMAKD